jgi:CRISPR-associated protein (TIGR02710 family)
LLILIASVGGSPAPIASAIAARKPDRVLFLASAPQPQRPGSADEIPGILQKAQRPQLPHDILRLADPDDPEAAFLALCEAVAALRQQLPRARFLFDYTGGTKSMTSAVFQCALATPGAELQFMGGRRADLTIITSGTERPVSILVDWLLAERRELPLRAAWKRFDYAVAAQGFRKLHEDLGSDEKAPEPLRQRLADLAALSDAFDLWDRFRHADAADQLRALATRHPALKEWADRAQRCSDAEPARILDLWRNAERCKARGRYDDAAARFYRLIEWIAQWRLLDKHKIDTGKLDWSRITEQEVIRAELREQRRKQTLSGLTQAWKLVAAKEPQGAVARFLDGRFPHKDPRKTGEGRLRDMLDLRNRSILAHGDRPLAEDDYTRWAEFMEEVRQRVLQPLFSEAGPRLDLPPQLPDDPAAFGL